MSWRQQNYVLLSVWSDNTAFWNAHTTLAGGYRWCPTAISPNLSNLQPTVHQITGGIERMHDGPSRVAILAVRQHFSPHVCPPAPPRTIPKRHRRRCSSWWRPSVGVGLTLRFRLRLRRASIAVTTVAWRRDEVWMANNCHDRQTSPLMIELSYLIRPITHHVSFD